MKLEIVRVLPTRVGKVDEIFAMVNAEKIISDTNDITN